MSMTNKERDEEIWRMHTELLMTLTAIGKKMGLSRERVRQIIEKKKESV
jgi:DNA-directed RNA polymerase sigma subunit (sigma70/sigma32)